eukprot:3511479-Pyramimonas_sp.AAC.1
MFRDGNSDLISTLSGGGVGGALYVEIGSHVTLDNVIFFGNRSDTAYCPAVLLFYCPTVRHRSTG